jgi:hypothetical protein
MNMAILIPSFDKYSFVWPMFFEFFKRNWGDCPFPVYLGTNFKSADLDWVTDVKIGQDTTWGLKVSNMLKQIPEEYVMIILEDFFIVEKVENNVIEGAFKFMQSNNIDCLGLHACPKPLNNVKDDTDVWGEIQPGEPYRINAQVAIWKKSSLMKILRPKFSPWDLERYGDVVAKKNRLSIWGSYRPILIYEHTIKKGLWLDTFVDYCKNNKIEFSPKEGVFDFSNRSYNVSRSIKLKHILKLKLQSLLFPLLAIWKARH